jgi:RNA polymerase sigma-70 factor, ECF subfamily
MEDNELIQHIKSGNKDAFRDFVDTYKKFVLNVCYKFLNDSDDANDVAQEVFIEVYKTIDKFRGDSKISTWLYRICSNRSLNFLRDNKKHHSIESYSKDPDYIVNVPSDSIPNPEQIALNNESADIINKAIDSLPETQKAVFILNKKDDLSYLEISKILGISVKAVESLIVRARKNLQKMLINHYKATR